MRGSFYATMSGLYEKRSKIVQFFRFGVNAIRVMSSAQKGTKVNHRTQSVYFCFEIESKPPQWLATSSPLPKIFIIPFIHDERHKLLDLYEQHFANMLMWRTCQP